MFLCGDFDRANDLAQSTCLRALEKHKHYETGTHLDRWLFVMARRIWLNDKRKEAVTQSKGFVSTDEIELPDNNASPEMNILANEVLSKLMGLPEAQRVTAMLVFVEGYSYREASEALEVPIGTIMSRISVARKKLAEEITVELRESGT